MKTTYIYKHMFKLYFFQRETLNNSIKIREFRFKFSFSNNKIKIKIKLYIF